MKKTEAKNRKDRASRQAKFREKQKKLGRRGRLYYLTDAEKEAIDLFLYKRRARQTTLIHKLSTGER